MLKRIPASADKSPEFPVARFAAPRKTRAAVTTSIAPPLSPAATRASWIARIEHLPPAPQVLPKLLQVMQQDDIALDEIVDLITHEPALAARVLQLSNSAFSGATTATADIGEAAFRVGLQPIFRMAVAISTQSTFNATRPEWGIRPDQLWRHSVTAALAAQLVAMDHAEDTSAAFTGGLLHDVGKVVLAFAFEREYGQLMAAAQGKPAALLALELEVCGADHADVGGHLLKTWGLPEAIVSAVAAHHRPAEAAGQERRVACLTLADSITRLIEAANTTPPLPEGLPVAPGEEDALRILGLERPQLSLYVKMALENFEFVEALCRG